MQEKLELTEDDKQLVKRLKSHYFIFPKGTVFTSAISTLIAVAGISYSTVKTVIESSTAKQAEAEILMAKASAIEANRLLQKLLSDVRGHNLGSGHLVLGDTLICYGTYDIPMRAGLNTHQFGFEFPPGQEFAAPPVVSESISCNSKGLTYTTYRHTVTTKRYSGEFTGDQGGKSEANVVSMSYIAIGKLK